ncbi:citrate lyase subunit beta / citryl-CoA lyase [Gammaproteobacteria bacterium]
MNHPALFSEGVTFPILPSCEHFAGNEKMVRKAFSLQKEKGPIFDVTLDCEDGAPRGKEESHVRDMVRLLQSKENLFKRAGVRIHDSTHPVWKMEVETVLAGAGEYVAYLTLPKARQVEQVSEMIEYVQETALTLNIQRKIPIHVLIETHGALRDVEKIAALPWIEVLDFGIMDFVSGHHGAIPLTNLKSPGQFEHALLYQAKTKIVSAALAHGVIPSHNVTLDLKNAEQTKQDAKIARYRFGFLRMWSIYPTQIDAIVAAMKPDHSEVGKAIRVLLAAQEANWGPIQLEGELHDRASYRGFWTLVQQAKMAGHVFSTDLGVTQLVKIC